MQAHSNTEIHFQRDKVILHCFGCGLFVLVGVFLLIYKNDEIALIHGIPVQLKWLGIVTTLFFGTILIFLIKRILPGKIALALDDFGLQDNSSLFSSGYVLWSDINSVSIITFNKQEIIMLELKDAEKYIAEQSNLLQKMLLRLNKKFYKAHFSISTGVLDISTIELYHMFIAHLNKSINDAPIEG